jgi:hypothetical protein
MKNEDINMDVYEEDIWDKEPYELIVEIRLLKGILGVVLKELKQSEHLPDDSYLNFKDAMIDKHGIDVSQYEKK